MFYFHSFKASLMKLDLEKGAYIQIGGELGKYNSLPIETLVKIAEDFQELILNLALYDLETTDPINPDVFKIELLDFRPGSAIPCFGFSPRAENKVGHNWEIHRSKVSEKFENLAEIAATGEYHKLGTFYPNPVSRNPIVESFYSLVNDFGSAPVFIVDYNKNTQEAKPIFKINRFNESIKKDLVTKVKVSKPLSESDIEVGQIKITKKNGKVVKRTVINSYSNKNYSLEYAPVLIVFENIKYILKYPLRCLFEKEDEYYVIQSEILDLIGTGLTVDEAELSFSEEFNYIFNKLNSLNDNQLTEHNKRIKLILNSYIKEIEQ